MAKACYLIMICLYVFIAVTWAFRYPVSYRLSNGSFEYPHQDSAYGYNEWKENRNTWQVRQVISKTFQISSVIVWLVSFLLLRKQMIRPRWLARTFLYVAAVAAIALTVADIIHFIPGPPVR